MRYHIADLIIDNDHSIVILNEQKITLPKLSYKVLLALIHGGSNWTTTDDLIRTVWDGVIVSDETVKQRVSLLRKSLGESARNPIYIESQRGIGYRIIPKIMTSEETIIKEGLITPSKKRITSTSEKIKNLSQTKKIILMGLTTVFAAYFFAFLYFPQGLEEIHLKIPYERREIMINKLDDFVLAINNSNQPGASNIFINKNLSTGLLRMFGEEIYLEKMLILFDESPWLKTNWHFKDTQLATLALTSQKTNRTLVITIAISVNPPFKIQRLDFE